MRLTPDQLNACWRQVDLFVWQEPRERQMQLWRELAERAGASHSKGHPYFRLGVLSLLLEPNESAGLRSLEEAYAEDERFGPESGQLPHQMGAYKLLSLTRDYFRHLRHEKTSGWEQALLAGSARLTLVETLLTVYDGSLVEMLDMRSATHPVFRNLIQDDDLSAYAIENYGCAERLLQMLEFNRTPLNQDDEYPLSRAVVGMLGGVLEALLCDRLRSSRARTLGGLLRTAHDNGVFRRGSRISALSSLMLYFRNHVHADVASQRTEFFIGLGTAKGCRVALDWALGEMIQASRPSEATS